jgi:hypothetical protein
LALHRFSPPVPQAAEALCEGVPTRASNPALRDCPERTEWAERLARKASCLPRPATRAKTGIVGINFGECGAIDFFGKEYGLPKSIGIHQNYFLWGPRNYTGEILIVLGD